MSTAVRAEPVEGWAVVALPPVRVELVEIGALLAGSLMWQHACVEGGSRVVAPAGEVLFFASPKKSTQKKGDPQSATPSLRYVANLRRGDCGVRRRTHFAALQLRSDNCGELEHEAWALRRPCHPTTAPPQAQPEGGGQPNSHTGRCCARPRLRSARRLRP